MNNMSVPTVFDGETFSEIDGQSTGSQEAMLKRAAQAALSYDEIVGTILFKHKDLQGDALASDFAAGQVQKNDQSKSRSIDAAWRQTVGNSAAL
jgi:hypothetical protein